MVSHAPWFVCASLTNSGDQHFSCQKYSAGPMVSHRVEDEITSEATLVPFWRCRGWDAAHHALLEQKTLPVHLVPRCGRSNCSGAVGDSARKSPSGQLPQRWALAGSWCGRAVHSESS